jgi:site-specific DNA-methyltransferase (adenine-specific)
MHPRSKCATSAPKPSEEGIVSSTASVVESDATEFLVSLSERPKLILTDPPYGMAYKSNIAGDKRWNSSRVPVAERRGRKGRFEVMQGDSHPDDIDFRSFFEAAYSALEDSAFLILFGWWEAVTRWRPLVESAGFKIREVLVWDKLCANGGDLGWPFIRTPEFILCCSKGMPKTYPLLNAEGKLKKRIPSVLPYGRTPKEEYVGHPTQKPLFLCSQLVRTFTNVGELVVDPFCGSGSSLVAAKLLGRRIAGCDVEPGFVSMTRRRLIDQSIEIKPPKSLGKGGTKKAFKTT